MRIGIVGAGAIGGWLGALLARTGVEVSALARGATLEALTAKGWTLEHAGETITARVRASADPNLLGRQDLLIIALKGPVLAAVAPTLSPMIGPDTVIMPAMNGVPWWFLLGGGGELGPTRLASVDPDGRIAAALPFDQILGCVVHASALNDGPGRVVHKAGNRLILGEPRGGLSTRLKPVAEVLGRAGLDVERSPSVRFDIWYKLWGNMTINPISAFTGATADRILDDPLVADFVLRVMAEAKAIGARIDCPIAERGEDRSQVTRRLGAFKTSMLQDAEAGRPLELDQLVAAPREIAGLLGLETPNLDALFGLSRLFGRSHDLYPAA